MWIDVKKQLPPVKQLVVIKYCIKEKEQQAVAWYDGGTVFNLKGSLRFQRLNTVKAWKPYVEYYQ